MLSNILWRLSSYIDKFIGNHHCGFSYNNSNIYKIFCICQILEKEWEYNETVHQLFIIFKKAYDSDRKVLYSVLIEFRVPMKLVMLIKMCLNETYSKDGIHKHLSDTFPIQNGLKQGGALLLFFFNFPLDYAIRKV
jgi:hypothetical protein